MHRRLGLPLAVLGAVLLVCLIPATRQPARPVAPFLIYYGWIPGGAAQRTLAKQFAGYPVVVLGSGEEWSGRGTDHAQAVHVIAAERGTSFYGYVNLGRTNGQPAHSLDYIGRALRAWRAMGARGVLLDCAGPDYGVSRGRLRAAVRIAHRSGLRVLVNAWDPSAVIGVGLTSHDAWLAENWVTGDGKVVAKQAADWPALRRLAAHGIAVWMTATDDRPPGSAWVDAWAPHTALTVGGNAIAVSGAQYSSRSNAVVPADWVTQALQGQ